MAQDTRSIVGTHGSKVAQVTLAFWLLKLCATTLGETAGDALTMTLRLGYVVGALLMVGVFVVTLLAQLSVRRFHPLLFWSVMLSTSIAGTALSDTIDRTLGLGYLAGTSLLGACVVLVLAVWYRVEGSVSVSDIASRRVETFYWLAILCSNTLGTALGDLLADQPGLGFARAALLVGSGIAATALAWRFTRANRVVLFWIAFVLTRPFGATFGDLLTKPADHGGLALGTIAASLVLSAIFAGLLAALGNQSGQPPASAV